MIEAVGIDMANAIVAAGNAVDFPNGHIVRATLDRILELLSGHDVYGNGGRGNGHADACHGIGASVG